MSWGNASSESLKPLHTLISRTVRIMSFAPFGHVNTKPIFEHLKLLDLDQTFQFETAKFIFKDKNNLLPIPNIANHFEIRSSNVFHRYNLRNRGINMPTISQKSSHGEKSIQFSGAKSLYPSLLYPSQIYQN